MIFDIDPGEGVPFGRVIEAALLMKAALEELELKSWLKTSGGNGGKLIARKRRLSRHAQKLATPAA